MTKPKALIFPNQDALLVALTSGMIPATMQGQPVRFYRKEQEIGVCPSGRVPASMSKQLVAAGVGHRATSEKLTEVGSWAELLAPNFTDESGLQTGLVLFALPSLEGGSSRAQEDGSNRALVDIAGELLRLGCDRQAYHIQSTSGRKGNVAYLRAADPPYFTVASALEKTAGFKAYVPVRPGQETVFIELGCEHPLKERIFAPAEQVVLIPRHGPWITIDNGPWTDIYRLIDFRLPEQELDRRAIPPPRRLEVPLRLVRASRSDPPTLWVVKDDAIEHIDRLVHTLPNDVLDRLLFAVAEGEAEPVVIIRARASRRGPPEIDLPGEAYLPLLTIPNLFTPKSGMIEPPLRRDKLRELLAPGEDQVAWLSPRGDERFQVETIAEQAFRPLSDWVDYILHAEARSLEPWVQGATFDFDLFVSTGAEWAEGPPPAPKQEQKKKPTKRRNAQSQKQDTHDAGGDVLELDTLPIDEPEDQSKTVDALLHPVDQDALAPDQERLAELQKKFLEMDVPLEDPTRRPIWIQMAQLNARLNQGRDAGLCWVSALWEADGEEAQAISRAWARSEVGELKKAKASIKRAMEVDKPSRGDVRKVVAALASCDLTGAPTPDQLGDVHQLQVWLDKHDDPLDVRTLWFGRVALANRVGGDKLAIARARDRILTRLRNGLSLARDVPTFLRFIGAGGDEGAVVKLAESLEQLLALYGKTKRKPSAIEAQPKLTGAYVKFIFAYGFARLGRADRARTLRDEARAELPQQDKIHGFLTRAYSARIDHALEGLPPETPLPATIAGELNELAKLERYKVDRLRDHSKILETQENIDPFQGYYQGNKDPRGEEFEKLRGMTDEALLAGEIAKLMEVATKAKPEERERLFDGIMDFFPLIPSKAVGHLETVVSHMLGIDPERRALLLEEALMLAGYFGREQLVKTLASELRGVLAQLGPEQMVKVASEFGTCLRGFKRVGLTKEASELIDAMSKSIAGQEVDALIARLHLAGALLYLGDNKRAEPVLSEAHERVEDAKLQGAGHDPHDAGLGQRLELCAGGAGDPKPWASSKAAQADDRQLQHQQSLLSVGVGVYGGDRPGLCEREPRPGRARSSLAR